MLYLLSLLARRYKRSRSRNKELRLFKDYTEAISQLPSTPKISNKILLIRLDDIGDYVLFRNTLKTWHEYALEQKKELYLLGNEAWKTLLEAHDAVYLAQAFWLNKKQYFNDGAYRQSLWGSLRAKGFETVICPARTRPILLDDVCMLAANAPVNIAVSNSLTDALMNRKSDELYSKLTTNLPKDNHEFLFNTAFARSVTSSTEDIQLAIKAEQTNEPAYILLFVGASAASKQWPVPSWNELILKLQQHFSGTILVAGGPSEVQMADDISKGTDAQNIAGTKSLPEMVKLISNAQLVVSNDTMAAHIAAASGVNTIIIANGTNAYRFTDYSQLGLQSVISIYSKRYRKLRHKESAEALQRFSGIRADIQSITVEEVYEKAKGYL